jgi:hypothetical protein
MRGRAFGAWIAAAGAVVVAQSILHFQVVLEEGRVGALVDLDRSNGVPDVVSTAVLATATVGAMLLVPDKNGSGRLLGALTAACLAALTTADLLHDGAHPGSANGRLVIALAVCTVALLGLTRVTRRGRVTLATGVCLLAGAFLVDGLDRLSDRLEPQRPDLGTESQIVAKEGLELLGWSLVTLALWDEALRRRRAARMVPTAPASRARAPSRRHAA